MKPISTDANLMRSKSTLSKLLLVAGLATLSLAA